MKPDSITITGVVTSVPVKATVWSQLTQVQFKIKTEVQIFDLNTGQYTTGKKNHYLVSAFNHLAVNLFNQVKIGDRVIVVGTLQLRSGEVADLIADSAGLDLRFPSVIKS